MSLAAKANKQFIGKRLMIGRAKAGRGEARQEEKTFTKLRWSLCRLPSNERP